MLVSDISGRTNILMKAKELGFKLATEAPETREITAKVKELEAQGYEYEAAEASPRTVCHMTGSSREKVFDQPP